MIETTCAKAKPDLKSKGFLEHEIGPLLTVATTSENGGLTIPDPAAMSDEQWGDLVEISPRLANEFMKWAWSGGETVQWE